MRVLILALMGAALLGAQDGSGHWIRFTFPALDSEEPTTSLFTQMSQEGRIPDKHEVEVDVSGAPSGCTYELEGSPDGDAPWHSITGEQDCTEDSAVGAINRFFPYVRVNLTDLTGGTSPSVVFTYIGVAQ